MSEKLNVLPNGWMLVKFQELFTDPQSDVVDGPFGSNLKSSEYTNFGIPLARLQNISRGLFVEKNMRYISEYKADDLIRHNFVSGDILISKLGDPLGEACIVPEHISRGVLVADVVRARITHKWLDRSFITHQINSSVVIEQFKNLTKGTTRPRVNLTKIRDLEVYLCTYKEQTRIVEKLEELLSDLDNGVAELKTAQIKLAQYRQSLLKSAVEGTLTQEWREANPHKIAETGEQLLARILKERRARWEKQKLEEFASKNQTPPKDWQKKYPEPVKPDTNDLPELPEGWIWASLSQIGWLDRGRSQHRPRSAAHLYGGNYPFVQTGDIRNSGQYIIDTAKTYSEAGLKQSRLWPKGTMCITIAANIGETSILSFDACFPDSVVGFIPVLSEQDIEFIEYSFRTLKEKLDSEAPATAQKNINLEILSKEVLPLPPIIEQVEIITKLNEGFSQIQSQLKAIEIGLNQVEAQRKNILKDAFSGKLVEQNPNDEPASLLLERIKAERALRAKQPKIPNSKKKASEKANFMKNLLEVLQANHDWIKAQDAFNACGVSDGTDTDFIEKLYAELRSLDKAERLEYKRDGNYDLIKLKSE